MSYSSSSSSRPQWKKRVTPSTDSDASASASASASTSRRGGGGGGGGGGGRGGAYVSVSHDDKNPSQQHNDNNSNEIKQSQHDDNKHNHQHQQVDGTSSARNRRNRSRNNRGRSGRGGVAQSHTSSSDTPYAHIHDATNNPITSSHAPSKVSSESTSSRSRPQQRIRPRVPLPSSASQLTSSLTEHLLAGTYDCSICSEPIKRYGGIWSCQRCYIIVHQKCIKKWWKTKMEQSGSKLLGEQSWHCPGCLFVHVDPPTEYTCWCGKITDPEPNPYLLPHSCGNICSRSRGTDCPHPCNELCHPGTCAPCPAMGPLRTCPCGRLDYRLRCGEVEKSRRTCDAICDRPLSCGTHRCTRTCHQDACGTCHITEEQTCFCGKEISQRACGSGTMVDGVKRFTCTNVCGKKLSCGNHTCTQSCHAGACTPCSRIPVTPQPCACGSSFPKTSTSRTSCLSPLPTCTSRCNRLLSCDQHTCQQLCHDSPCRPCTTIVKRTCRCMQSVINIPCMEMKKSGTEDVDENGNLINEIRCGRVCKVKLACGRHTCNERCCSSEINPSHLCLRVCGKPSPCGVSTHTCDRFCHLGPCPPCAVTFRDGITCRCGAARIPGPITCGTEPPHCNKPCSIPRSCGHTCAYTCHQKECPPCAVLTTRLCSGGHRELKNIPCYAATISCGIICKKPLSCGQHICKRVCHGGECIPTITTTSNESKQVKTYASLSKSSPSTSTSNGGCTQKCGEKRFDCEHLCKAICHPNKPCPDLRCDELVTIYCTCRRIHRDVVCGMGGGNRNPPAQLECDDQCEVEARNARFRQALAVEDRPHIPYPTVLLEHLLNLDVGKYVPKMEQILADFLAKPLSMSQPTKTLPPMPGDQRWLLHQMASYYGIDSESFDPEPRRSIRLIRSRTSAIPSMLLSQAIRLYIPYRRDPTQSNAIDISQPSCILHFYHLDIHPAISPSDLRLCLKPWEGHFKINWLDHTHAFVTFDDAARCIQAREILGKKGIFRFEEEIKPGSTKLERALTTPGDTTSTSTTTTSTSTSTSTNKPAITDFAASFYAAGAGDVSSSSSASTSTSSSTASSTSPSITPTATATTTASISPYIAAYKPPTEFQPVKSRMKQRPRITPAPKRDAWDEENESIPVKSTWEDEDEEESVRDTSGSWRKAEATSTSTSTSVHVASAPSNSKKAAPKPAAGNMFAAFDSDED